MANVMKKKIWYAVLTDNEDNDWGTGSTRKRDAIKMVRQLRRGGYTDAFIAVIDDTKDDKFCLDEIHDI